LYKNFVIPTSKHASPIEMRKKEKKKKKKEEEER
jgi:hypothetical protein